MRRHLWIFVLAAVLMACQPNPNLPTDPIQPVITSFTASPASGVAPFTTALTWVISDANGDSLSCTLDTDGDGTFETTLPYCSTFSSSDANLTTAGTKTLTLRVTDGNTAPVEQTLIVAASTPSTDTFGITLRLNGSMSPSQQAVFEAATARWAQVIKTGLSDVAITLAADDCDTGLPAFSGTVDDLMIDASVVPIDGVGGILGSAGPCLVRNSNKLPIYGTMQFDSADVAQMESNGQLYPVILHEMGHVLGFGTVWSSLGVLQGSGGADPRFTGGAATGEWQRLGGFNTPLVENTGGPGTANSHWREITFGNELMTGYVNSASNPLSRLTAASLGDLGYGVDLSQADPYGLPALRAPGSAPSEIDDGMTLLTPRRSI